MKRLLWALVAGTVCFGMAAQEAQARPFYFGFRAGLGVGSQSPDPGDTDGSRIGIAAGGVIGYPVTPNVALETGLLYVLKGAKYKGANEQGQPTDDTSKLDYLVIPAVARASFGPPEGLQPFVLGGLDLGILTKAEYDREGDSPIDTKDNYKSTDIALRLGAGAAIPAGGYDFVVELAYSLGLTDILDYVPPANSGNDQTLKNRALTVTAGVNF